MGSGRSVTPAAAGSFRARMERRFGAPLAYAATLPRWLIIGIIVAPALVAAFVQGIVGAVALGLLALVLLLLAYLSWPALTPSGRLLRVTTIGLVVVLAVTLPTR